MDHNEKIRKEFSRQADSFGKPGLTLSSQEYLAWMVDILPLHAEFRVLDRGLRDRPSEPGYCAACKRSCCHRHDGARCWRKRKRKQSRLVFVNILVRRR